jgi:hypothetical protein
MTKIFTDLRKRFVGIRIFPIPVANLPYLSPPCPTAPFFLKEFRCQRGKEREKDRKQKKD